MNRRPPVEVRRQLRREVGFGCPIPGCGIPYLTWHHFDPPWHIRQHHEPEGMIALCLNHAGNADANLYDNEYLRSLKAAGRPETAEVRGKLEWMQQDVLARLGGLWCYRPMTGTVLEVGSTRAVWFGRDEDGYLLTNVRMPSLSGEPRVRIEDNFFTIGRDHVADIECAARGRTIRIDYPNGDCFKHEFRNVSSEDDLRTRYDIGGRVPEIIPFPITVVEMSERTADPRFNFDQNISFGASILAGWAIACGTGVHLGVSPEEEAFLFSGSSHSNEEAGPAHLRERPRAALPKSAPTKPSGRKTMRGQRPPRHQRRPR